MKKIVIIGATSTLAEYCAREWIMQPSVHMILVGRRAYALQCIADDLHVRAPQNRTEVTVINFNDPAVIKKTVDDICEKGVPDTVLIAHGNLPDQNACQADVMLCYEAMAINALSPMLFAEAFAKYMDAADKGTLAIIGSVAGDRGRRSNYVYGAAKGLVARYTEGLQHRFCGRNIKVVLIKPGPTDTKMTAHLKNSGAKLADATRVAAVLVNGIAKGQRVVYAPKPWRIIMMVIRHLPFFIFGKMKI